MTAAALSLSDLQGLTLPQALERRAKLHGGAVALRQKTRGVWRPITWADYFDNVRRFAAGLHAIGFREGDRLAIASENTPEWFYADLAAQLLGGSGLGVYPTNPWPELQYIVRHSQASVIVCGDQEQTDKVLEAAANGGLPDLRAIITVDTKGMRSYADPLLRSFADVIALGGEADAATLEAVDRRLSAGRPEDTAIVVYTSGTTGMPKGAMLSHANMLHSAAQVARTAGLTASTYSVVCYLPLCHVAERSFSACMQLVTGCVVAFAESIDTVVANLREIAPLGFLGVPRIWEKMQQTVLFRVKDATKLQQRVFAWSLAQGRPIALRRLDNGGAFASPADRLKWLALWLLCFRGLQSFLGLNRMRNGFCGGATVSPEVLIFFWILGLPVYQIYGMTESAGVSHMQRPGFTAPGCSGLVIEGVDERVAADGELQLRGASVFKGYLFDEAATARTVVDGWLNTGDVVEHAPDGELRVVDRKKDIIITSGGKNITPSLIENALKDSLYIREAILLGDGRHFLSALVQIDFDAVGKWAQEQGLTYTTYRSLAENERVRELVQREIDQVNARFARVENIRKFVILAKELDHDDGELTATMKVRRRTIESKFGAEITQIYGSAA